MRVELDRPSHKPSGLELGREMRLGGQEWVDWWTTKVGLDRSGHKPLASSLAER